MEKTERKVILDRDNLFVPSFIVSDFYLESRKLVAEAIEKYSRGEIKPIAKYKEGRYKIEILGDYKGRHDLLYFREDISEPVPSGLWMDWREKHWGLTEEEYRRLSLEERAKLEAKEQMNWIGKEFEELWVEYYIPRDYPHYRYMGWNKRMHKIFERENKTSKSKHI